MTEMRTADLSPATRSASGGMEPVTDAAVSAHADEVLITGLNGQAVAIGRRHGR